MRETDGILYYEYQFENPVDLTLPRPRSSKPEKIIELYALCVAKGKLWSVQATVSELFFFILIGRVISNGL